MRSALAAVEDPERVAALRRLLILDTDPSVAFDRLTRLAARVLDVPISLLTLIDRDRQHVKSSYGLPEPLRTQRDMPLSHSICKHVVASGRPLVIDDARAHPATSSHPAVVEHGVAAYAGVPLVTQAGHAVGSLCAVDTEPRRWTPDDVEVLTDLAAVVMSEVRLHWLGRYLRARQAWRGAGTGGHGQDRLWSMP